MKIGVIGAGSWGTALAKMLAETGNEVTIWAYEKEVVESINENHTNNLFLSGFALPKSVSATNEIAQAIKSQAVIVLVTPSHTVRRIVEESVSLFEPEVPIVCCSKGIENDTLLLMSEVLEEILPNKIHPYLAFLSGPSFAREVAMGQPTVVTIASYMKQSAVELQRIFSNDRLRAYHSTDVVGVEIGGALKNVIAIATGMAEGLGLGENTRAALITRGLAEISRLAVRKGANPLTLSGPSGVGDLVLTCAGALSRNRSVGIRLGKGEKISAILESMIMVAEGVKTTKSAFELSRKLEVVMPITEAMYDIIYGTKQPAEVVQLLMTRKLKGENE